MPKKIEDLSPEQWADMRQVRDEAYRKGSCTALCDRPRFEKAVVAMYAEIGKPAPKFVWCPGPTIAVVLPVVLRNAATPEKNKKLGDQLRGQLGGQLRGQLWDQLGGQLRGQLWDQLRGQLGDQLGGQLRGQLWDQLRGQLGDQLGGQLWDQLGLAFWGGHELFWPVYYDFCAKVGVKYAEVQARRLQMWIDVCEAGHWWWPMEGYVFASERPHTCKVDDDRRLDCEDGPALAYHDGTEIYAIGGVRLEKWVVMEPAKITLEHIDKEDNAEKRRIMTQRYGVGRYLVDTGAKVIELDQGGGLNDQNSRVLYEDKRGRKWLEGTDGSTGRVYFMQVPPEVKTCREAHGALCGFDESLIVSES
jgi:hypothetical protein